MLDIRTIPNIELIKLNANSNISDSRRNRYAALKNVAVTAI